MQSAENFSTILYIGAFFKMLLILHLNKFDFFFYYYFLFILFIYFFATHY